MAERTWRDRWNLFRLVLAVRLWPSAAGGFLDEGNRRVWTMVSDDAEFSLTVRHLSEPDAYGRESVYRMLRTVREQERRMGWVCPEPECDR